MKVRGLQEKYLLKKTVAPLLPPEISARRKRPYRAPIASAFVGPGAPEYVRELLDPERLRDVGLFDPDAIIDRAEREIGLWSDGRWISTESR